MAFKVVPVSKLEAPEPGFSGLWACCRDVRRSLSSSPPSFCFQPVSPPLRLWWFRGPAPRGLGPVPAPVPPLPSFSCPPRCWSLSLLLWFWRCRLWATCPSLHARLILAVTSSRLGCSLVRGVVSRLRVRVFMGDCFQR